MKLISDKRLTKLLKCCWSLKLVRVGASELSENGVPLYLNAEELKGALTELQQRREADAVWERVKKACAALAAVDALPKADAELPILVKGQKVIVSHDRYDGLGIVVYDTGSRARVVLLGNGNVWEYERETVALAPVDAPKGVSDGQ